MPDIVQHIDDIVTVMVEEPGGRASQRLEKRTFRFFETTPVMVARSLLFMPVDVV